MSQSNDYKKELNKFLEPPITKEEMKQSKIIREYLKNNKFDELYNIIPNEIAKLINSKYRVLEV